MWQSAETKIVLKPQLRDLMLKCSDLTATGQRPTICKVGRAAENIKSVICSSVKRELHLTHAPLEDMTYEPHGTSKCGMWSAQSQQWCLGAVKADRMQLTPLLSCLW